MRVDDSTHFKAFFLTMLVISFLVGIFTFDFQNPGPYTPDSNDTLMYSSDSLITPDILEVWYPDPKLADSDLWEQVGPYRYECKFLRLAILWTGTKYALVEMDGDKRVLALSSEYSDIQQAVTKLTLKEY